MIKISQDIWEGVFDFLIPKKCKLVDFVQKNIDKVNWEVMAAYCQSLFLLEQNPEKINWKMLSCNPAAIHLLEQNIPKVDWYNLYTSWSYLDKKKEALELIERYNYFFLNWVACVHLSIKDECELTNAKKIIKEIMTFRYVKRKLIWKNMLKDNNLYHIDFEFNQMAINLLEKNQDQLDEDGWQLLSRNSSIHHLIPLLQKNLDKLYWRDLCQQRNPNLMPFLEQHMDRISWTHLSSNPVAIHILEQNLDKVDWTELCANENAGHILEQNIELVINEVYWEEIPEYNETFAQFIVNNIDRLADYIDWSKLSSKAVAIPVLRQNLDRVDWSELSKNQGAIDILEKYQDKVEWNSLSCNNSILVEDEKTFRKIVLEKVSQLFK